jgi:mycothiol system anti-sigma-R factor
MDDQQGQYRVEDLMGGGDCEDALETLYRFLDGELTPDRRVAIQRHLDECAPCLHAFGFEAELKVLIRRSCQDQLPDHLRHKIAQILDEASRGDRGSV